MNTIRISLALLCLSFLGSSAWADGITYDVSVDTSSIAGTAGAMDFNFNPGPLVTQAASLQILVFSSDGALAGGPTLTGDVSGALPATLTFDNATALNDYFTGFTFGNALSFTVNLFGPAVTAPDGTSTSGSTFAFSMFSDSDGTVPTLSSDANGFALTADINLDGTTTINNSSPELTVTTPTAAVPEPGTILLLASGLFGMGLFKRLKKA